MGASGVVCCRKDLLAQLLLLIFFPVLVFFKLSISIPMFAPHCAQNLTGKLFDLNALLLNVESSWILILPTFVTVSFYWFSLRPNSSVFSECWDETSKQTV